MDWRRTLLSIALVGGCIWCLGMVQKAHSEERGISVTKEQSQPTPQSMAAPERQVMSNG